MSNWKPLFAMIPDTQSLYSPRGDASRYERRLEPSCVLTLSGIGKEVPGRHRTRQCLMLPALIGVNRRNAGVLLRTGGCAGHAYAMLVNEFPAGLSLVAKR